jgi:hydroxymethylpyrimidine kinase/phosphomethylpyrimidine kinase
MGNRFISSSLKFIKTNKIVLDPVMVAKGGAKLIDDKAINLLKNKLVKRVTLITPNIPEAEILANMNIKCKEDMIFAANKLIEIGANNVLIKGGHLTSNIVKIYLFPNLILKLLIVKDTIQKIPMEQVVLYLVQSLHFYHVENL